MGLFNRELEVVDEARVLVPVWLMRLIGDVTMLGEVTVELVVLVNSEVVVFVLEVDGSEFVAVDWVGVTVDKVLHDNVQALRDNHS